MKKSFVLFAVVALLAGCKGKGWSKADRDAFTDKCVSEAKGNIGEDKAKSYCSCMQGKLEAKYSNPGDAMKMEESAMTAMAKECLK
jgi:hypothetical protein